MFGCRGQFDECRRVVNPITGEKKVDYCSIERKDWYPLPTCGPDAKYFEKR